MSVASATAAASTRHRRDSRASNPGKMRESITPKMSHVEGLEEFQRYCHLSYSHIVDSLYYNSKVIKKLKKRLTLMIFDMVLL